MASKFVRGRSPKERLQLKRVCVDMLGGKCINCGFNSHLAALEFDHIDPKKKYKSVSDLLLGSSWETIQQEVKKCVLLCANCHRIKTHPNATD
jgi:5-methylcytosine-specific restriction endonuclease McrA